MNLRTKFSLLFLLFILLVLGTFSGTYYFLEQRSETQKQRLLAQAAIKKIASACQEAMQGADWIPAINLIKVVHEGDPGVLFSDCHDLQGRIWAHSESEKIGAMVAEKATPSTKTDFSEKEYRDEKGNQVWQIAQPLRLHRGMVGTVRIGYDATYLKRQIQDHLWSTIHRISLVSSLTSVVAVLAATLIALSLIRPIRALVLATEKIKSGELGYQSPVANRKDELGRLAAAFNQMARKLAELDELKDEFISMVSHDLRGPLASIKMHLDYLLSETRGGINEEQAEMLKICVDSAASLSLFINNILNTAKIKAGKMEYILAPFSLADAVEPVLKLMQMEADHKKITIATSGLDQAPALLGDIDKIEHVFANLLFNALKYTPAGGRIWVQWQMDSSPEKVRVTVGNTGEGIPPDNIPNLFSRFYQVDAKKQKDMRIRGTGLGLALVKETLEAQQGRVWVESKAGQGVQFHFTLPLAAKTESGEKEHRHVQDSPYR